MLCMCIGVVLYGASDATLDAMEKELERSYRTLSKTDPVPLYFLQYEIYDEHEIYVNASQGAIFFDNNERNRYLDIDVRVGSPKLDNTHEIRSSTGFDYLDWIPSIIHVPIEEDREALQAILWIETDRAFKDAQERYTKVLAEKQVKVAETDTSPDFSLAPSVSYFDAPVTFELNLSPWYERLRGLSLHFSEHTWLFQSQISLRANKYVRYIVNTDGTRIRENRLVYRLSIYAATMADDGMELYLSHSFYATDPSRLPEDEEIVIQIDSIIENLDALRKAPIVEPYTGPAILVNQASGVFFHEIFGHRIEGHRQKSEFEGQTFTKKVGQQILPEFISIYDDPTMPRFNDKDLNGHYRHDDEGVAAKRVTVVENGILKEFLMGRSPIEGFPNSNGHGRRSHGKSVVARQGVLFIKSNKEVSFEELRTALIEECKRQDKEYGLIFYDISGGFTSTGRSGTQSFKVIPLLVKRIYVDERPDEVVRGVDIVGTPLLSFSKIQLTGDDYDIFNGTCGAESGWVPVSAISPSIFVSEIEVEKKAKAQDKPPILPAPEQKGLHRRIP
jgi:predicted Zn-dependent protease